MANKNRKTSSYYILKNDEKLDLKTQRYKVISSTLASAIGILTIAAVCLSSDTALTASMTAGEFFAVMFGGSASILGTFGTVLNGVEYETLKDDIHERAEKEGRVRK